MTTAKERDRDEAREKLREWIKPGDTVYCVLRHRSASGMSRVIDFKTVDCSDQGAKRFPDRVGHVGWLTAKATGYSYDQKREGVKVGGCGMDMGFAVVYDLAAALYGDGYECLGDGSRCPSNWHINSYEDEQGVTHPAPFYERSTEPHRDGYALKHRWL
jgi:hypothetical protein